MRLQDQLEYPPRSIDPAQTCLFLDFDGTLVEFSDHPDEVVLPARVRSDVAQLHDRLDGALAIVTGRRIEDIDTFFAPMHLPVGGVHGLVRRDARGALHITDFDGKAVEELALRLKGFMGAEAGLLLERKPGSVALHFRKRPELESVAIAAMEEATAAIMPSSGPFRIMRGKMVIEARAAAANKAQAIADFLREPPFSGRMAVFAGDDVTDEDGFLEINARGGMAIKIGAGDTCAAYRVATIAAFGEWLHRLAEAVQ